MHGAWRAGAANSYNCTALLDLSGDSEKIPQHENGDICVTKKYFQIIFLAYWRHISSQVCLILFNLLNVWRNDVASKSMFYFRQSTA